MSLKTKWYFNDAKILNPSPDCFNKLESLSICSRADAQMTPYRTRRTRVRTFQSIEIEKIRITLRITILLEKFEYFGQFLDGHDLKILVGHKDRDRCFLEQFHNGYQGKS